MDSVAYELTEGFLHRGTVDIATQHWDQRTVLSGPINAFALRGGCGEGGGN